MSDNPYERIEVLVAGREYLSARPIDFELDGKGVPIEALRYETTCPKCGGMIQFDRAEAMDGSIDCPECARDVVPPPTGPVMQQSEIVIRPRGQLIEKTKRAVPLKAQCPFVDPVEVGMFDPVDLFEEAEEPVPPPKPKSAPPKPKPDAPKKSKPDTPTKSKPETPKKPKTDLGNLENAEQLGQDAIKLREVLGSMEDPLGDE